VKGTRWIVFVVVLLLGNVGAVSALIAAAGGSDGRVLPDYYRRAAAWSQPASQIPDLVPGWTARIEPRADGLTVWVADRDGQPVRGAAVRVAAQPVSATSGAVVWIAVEREPGEYRTTVAPAPGRWELDLQVHRGDVAWTRRTSLEVTRP
jgi:nitrogen fixation protein FixH